MSRKGHPNEFWHVASLITERLCANNSHPEARERVFKTTMAQLSKVCGAKAVVRYPLNLVYLSWLALVEKAIAEDWPDLPSPLAVIRSYPKTAPPWIEAWPKRVLAEVPPVYESYQHDKYVQDNAVVLRMAGFHYCAWASESAQWDGSRLTYEQVEALGLLPE